MCQLFVILSLDLTEKYVAFVQLGLYSHYKYLNYPDIENMSKCYTVYRSKYIFDQEGGGTDDPLLMGLPSIQRTWLVSDLTPQPPLMQVKPWKQQYPWQQTACTAEVNSLV